MLPSREDQGAGRPRSLSKMAWSDLGPTLSFEPQISILFVCSAYNNENIASTHEMHTLDWLPSAGSFMCEKP